MLRVVGTPARVVSAVLVVVALSAQVWVLVTRGSFNLRRLASDDPRAHVDFDSFHRSAQALLRGADIYDTAAVLPNLNPPLLTVVLAPLGALGAQAAYRVLLLVTVVLVLGCVLVVAREVRLPAPDTGLAVAAVLLSGPLLATLGLGQIYALLTVTLTASWLAQRRGMPVVAGVALGAAAALKPSLAPLLLLPVLRRSWRTAAAAGLTAVLGTGVGVLVAGSSASLTWVGLVLDNPVQTYVDNASLPATMVRLTSDTGYGQPLVELPGGAVVGAVAGAVVLVATLWLARGPSEYGLWAVAAASLVASPVTWHTYLVVLVPGMVLVLVRSRVLAAPLLALLLIGQEWPGLVLGEDGAGSALPVSLYAGVLLAYWAAFLACARDVVRPRVASSP